MRDASPYRVEIVEGLVNQPAKGRRQLASTEVVVALARPDEVGEAEQRSTLMALLSDEEKKRLWRFHFERDRDLFLMAHALLRITLSRHASIEPYAWRFRKGSHGRPEIAEPRSRLRFSLSHTHQLAACAVVLDCDVGLDVEYLSSDPPIDLAERFFSPRERCDILNASLDARARLFLEYWTLKEAYAKARGLGLSLPLDQFSLYKETDGRWRIALESPLHEDQERWRFWSWHVRNDHQVALAIDQGELVL
jgi:4'-phosphopantetheinyl transferase